MTDNSGETKHSFDSLEEKLSKVMPTEYQRGYTDGWMAGAETQVPVEEAQPKKEIEKPEPLLQFFTYAHLSTGLQAFSKPFHDLAHELVKILPRNPERTVMLRKLLEAKDCSVRAFIYKEPKP